MLQIHQSGNHDFKWISFVMSIFDNIGLSYIVANQLNINIHSLKPVLKERLRDHFIQQWFTRSSNLNLDLKNTYQNYQSKIGLIYQNNRCSGGWQNIAGNDRMCTLCRGNIGDEFHYLFICKHQLIAALRPNFIPKYYTSNPTIHKIKGLFSLCNGPVLKNISLFISKLMFFF